MREQLFTDIKNSALNEKIVRSKKATADLFYGSLDIFYAVPDGTVGTDGNLGK